MDKTTEVSVLRFAKLYTVAGALWQPVSSETLRSHTYSSNYDVSQRYPEDPNNEPSLALDQGTVEGAVHEFYSLMPSDMRDHTLPHTFFDKVHTVFIL
jgi:hypothetical protein